MEERAALLAILLGTKLSWTQVGVLVDDLGSAEHFSPNSRVRGCSKKETNSTRQSRRPKISSEVVT